MKSERLRNNTIYVFRCSQSGLYALTHDRTGQSLPSKIYPRLCWQLERIMTLRRDKSSKKQDLIRATLHAIRERGFYLSHAAIEPLELLPLEDRPASQKDLRED
jgi:hypothetical protein